MQRLQPLLLSDEERLRVGDRGAGHQRWTAERCESSAPRKPGCAGGACEYDLASRAGVGVQGGGGDRHRAFDVQAERLRAVSPVCPNNDRVELRAGAVDAGKHGLTSKAAVRAVAHHAGVRRDCAKAQLAEGDIGGRCIARLEPCVPHLRDRAEGVAANRVRRERGACEAARIAERVAAECVATECVPAKGVTRRARIAKGVARLSVSGTLEAAEGVPGATRAAEGVTRGVRADEVREVAERVAAEGKPAERVATEGVPGRSLRRLTTDGHKDEIVVRREVLQVDEDLGTGGEILRRVARRSRPLDLVDASRARLGEDAQVGAINGHRPR